MLIINCRWICLELSLYTNMGAKMPQKALSRYIRFLPVVPSILSSQYFTRVVDNTTQRRLFQKSKASKQGYINMKPHLQALCKDSETCRKSSNQIKNCSRNNITTLQKKQLLNFNVEVYPINSLDKFNCYILEFPHFFKD